MIDIPPRACEASTRYEAVCLSIIVDVYDMFAFIICLHLRKRRLRARRHTTLIATGQEHIDAKTAELADTDEKNAQHKSEPNLIVSGIICSYGRG